MRKNSLLMIFCFLMSCQNGDVNFSNIKYIEVYSVSFNLRPMVSISKDQCMKAEPYLIKDGDMLKQIGKVLNSLKESPRKKYNENIYLICQIYFENNSMVELLYNQQEISLNNKIYLDSDKLIQLVHQSYFIK